MTLTRKEAEAIGQAVNKPASTIYRWRKDNPELFEAVREYAQRQQDEPDPGRAYREGYRAGEVGLGISDCPYVTTAMTAQDKALADAWIQGLSYTKGDAP